MANDLRPRAYSEGKPHRQPSYSTEHVRAIKFATAAVTLPLVLPCDVGAPSDETLGSQDHFPTPDRAQVQIIDRELPDGLTYPAARAAYD